LVERRTLLLTFIIVALVSATGYAVGRFSTLEELEPATTTSTTTSTRTVTSSAIVTETVTKTAMSTTTTVMEPPTPIPPPANSSAVIHGHYLLNGSIFLMFSIDKPTYVLGETVHIRGTLTNLTPDNISLSVWEATTTIIDEKRKNVWRNPEWDFLPGLGPPPIEEVDLRPKETRSLDWATADWNMTGLHRTIKSSAERSRVLYNDSPVPEGQYDLLWRPEFWFRVNNQLQIEEIEDTISFTITK
jgi:hypothetical protein